MHAYSNGKNRAARHYLIILDCESGKTFFKDKNPEALDRIHLSPYHIHYDLMDTRLIH